jgi:hypothetical protein
MVDASDGVPLLLANQFFVRHQNVLFKTVV